MMRQTEILLSIKDFEARYRLTRSNIYNRINGLKDKGYPMEPMKQGNKSIYSVDQAALMDRLDEHIEDGNDIASFPDPDGRTPMPQPVERLTSHPIEQIETVERSPVTLGIASLVDAIAGKLVEVIPAPSPNPLADLRLIHEAYEHGWLLSSSQLATLLGLKTLSGASFTRYGYNFTRHGKNGSESAWKITREAVD